MVLLWRMDTESAFVGEIMKIKDVIYENTENNLCYLVWQAEDGAIYTAYSETCESQEQAEAAAEFYQEILEDEIASLVDVMSTEPILRSSDLVKLTEEQMHEAMQEAIDFYLPIF